MAGRIAFCDDSRLGYDASRRPFAPGESLAFDDSYRLAHLPLVAPQHPEIIRQVEGKDYVDGRYVLARYSLVVPVPFGGLIGSETFQAFEREMRSTTFASKINWSLCDQRSDRLHATVVNGLQESDFERCANAVEAAVSQLGPLSMRLGGPFLGRMNTGRIYLPVYPQLVAGEDAFALVQNACGARVTRFYVVGYYHLTEALNVAETEDLARIAAKWQHRVLAEMPINSFDVQATNDDLALSARIVRTIQL
jgi:hypothetical protein